MLFRSERKFKGLILDLAPFYSPRRPEGHEGLVGRMMLQRALQLYNGFTGLDWTMCVGSPFFVRFGSSW